MKWISTFKYTRFGYGEDVIRFSDTTQRVFFDNNVDGNKVRLRFTNRCGLRPIRIDAVSVGKLVNGEITDCAAVKRNGAGEITLEPGQECFSDEIEFAGKAGDKLVVSIYFGGEQTIDAMCCFWDKTGSAVTWEEGDSSFGKRTKDKPYEIIPQFMKDDPNTPDMSVFFGFDAVQILADDEVRVIAAFGDSITHMSMFTNALGRRIADEYKGKAVLLNCGIGGNRLVSDATVEKTSGKQLVFFGEAGVKRFERDVFETDDVDCVLALEGINDIMHPVQLEGSDETTPAADIIAGYKEITDIAHDNGAEIYFGTVTPCWNPDYPADWLAKFETTRNTVNDWIRQGEGIDGFFDYDRAVYDPARAGYMREGLHIGDGLHPGPEGGSVMAQAVDLKTVIG